MSASKRSKLLAICVYALLFGSVVVFLYVLTSRMQTRGMPLGSVELTTPYDQYLLGEEIKFSITNNYNSSIYIINSCPSEPLEVYRYEAETWVRQHDTADDKVCTEADRKIEVPAGAELTSSFSLWKHLFEKPGKYRIATFVDYYGAIPYADFEIIEKPAVPEIPSATVAENTSTTSASAAPSSSTTTSTPPAASTAELSAKTITLPQGTVSVEYSSTTVYIRSIVPQAGYSYESSGSGQNVEITFKGSGNETQLQLSVRNGQLVQKIESD